ncbi:class I SAM-dependent methyltransferase [Phytohabitans sp. LJ34]|uniref:class I SAM-dependent methyltransferase n=1 Tax=Phytohabitans sp. LJ34 TaxID=3452217 RepID=UPI003F892B86
MTPPTGTVTPYPLDNTADGADAHHHGLAHLLDNFSQHRLAGLRDWSGAHVLEVGCGKGSFARRLADMVGDSGHVTATDLKPPALDHDRITVIQHDLTSDTALPAGPFDGVHTRLVLQHLPTREDILDRLIAVLRPGGVLIEEAWRPVRVNPVVAAPDPDSRYLYERFAHASGRIFDDAGTDPHWAKQVPTAMENRGLTNVDTVIHGSFWRGGDPAARMVAGTIPQLADGLLAKGFTTADIDAVLELLHNPALKVESHLLYSTSGYVPQR